MARPLAAVALSRVRVSGCPGMTVRNSSRGPTQEDEPVKAMPVEQFGLTDRSTTHKLKTI
jgi:hypothetical protein